MEAGTGVPKPEPTVTMYCKLACPVGQFVCACTRLEKRARAAKAPALNQAPHPIPTDAKGRMDYTFENSFLPYFQATIAPTMTSITGIAAW